MRRMGLATLCLGVFFASAPQACGTDFLQWLKKEVFDHITLAGNRRLGYHQHTVEGDQDAFNILNYYGEGGKTWTDYGYMTVTGTDVLGTISFQSMIETSRFKDPQNQRFTLNYDRKPVQIQLGDIHGGLHNTNRFAPFTKLLKGVVAGVDKGRFKAKAMYSAARGSARTITLQGNNSSGPYYLSFGQIVRGSESVQVDGMDMVLGKDYAISYEAGVITFVDRIVPPTSTITVTFEALSNRTGSGTIQGGSMQYDFGRIGRLGLTAMEQKSGSSGALSTRLELFQGSGAASTPYFLQFEPLMSQPITVRLDGIIQAEGVDYYFDTTNPTIFYFTRFISFESTISVLYTPKPTQALDGDRRVWGLDYRIGFGKAPNTGYIAYSQATGRLISPVNPLSGTARGVDIGYKTGGWNFTSSIRNVPNGFVSVETRGFNRNEKAVDFGASYDGKGPWTLDFKQRNSAVAQRSTDSNGNVQFRTARQATFDAHASYSAIVGQPWDLEYRRVRSSSAGKDTRSDSAALSTSRTFGRLITHFDLEHTDAKGPVSNLNVVETKRIQLETLRASSTYSAGRAWSFGMDAGISAIKAGEDQGTGTDLNLRATYEPNENRTVTVGYLVSNSGKVASLGGFETGFGFGYGGNGYSGGYAGTPFSVGATNVRQFRLGTTSRMGDKVTWRANYFQTRNTGSITSNSETQTIDGGAAIQLGANQILTLDLTKSNTKYVGLPTRSDATTFNLGLQGDPKGPWSYTFGASTLLTGGNSLYKQDGTQFNGNLTYEIGPRQRLLLDITRGRTRGYLGQSEFLASASYQYQIWKSLALVAGYKFRDVQNLDSSATSGAYRSKGFDVELSFTFGG